MRITLRLQEVEAISAGEQWWFESPWASSVPF